MFTRLPRTKYVGLLLVAAIVSMLFFGLASAGNASAAGEYEVKVVTWVMLDSLNGDTGPATYPQLLAGSPGAPTCGHRLQNDIYMYGTPEQIKAVDDLIKGQKLDNRSGKGPYDGNLLVPYAPDVSQWYLTNQPACTTTATPTVPKTQPVVSPTSPAPVVTPPSGTGTSIVITQAPAPVVPVVPAERAVGAGTDMGPDASVQAADDTNVQSVVKVSHTKNQILTIVSLMVIGVVVLALFNLFVISPVRRRMSGKRDSQV